MSMIDSIIIAEDVLEQFPSPATLHAAHAGLLQRRRRGGDSATFLDAVAAFIHSARATGALLDADDDRRAGQSLLDYWSNILYRAGREPPDDILAEFDPALAPALDDALCPYMGLDAFHEFSHNRFFGRQRLVAEAISRLTERRLLALVGPSGSGKSSLVRGGIVPALKAGALPGSQGWRYLAPMVPGSEPLASLERALRTKNKEQRTKNQGPVLEDSAPLLDAPVVLVVDQFEELFTLCDDRRACQAFIDNLLELVAAPDAQHIVILTMRSDFEAFVTRLPAFHPVFEQGRLQVTPLNAAELREAIEQPAELIGLKFEDGVVNSLLQDILGEPAALPLLQFTLLKLWEHRERNRVTWDAYRRLGGGRLALANSADVFYDRLIPEEQITAKRILLRMVRLSDGLEVTSNRIRREMLYRAGEAHDRVDRVLEKLIGARLVRLTAGELPADDQVEVAHEALVRNWPRLVDWLRDEREAMVVRRRLEVKADEWVRLGQGRSGLLDDVQLAETERWLASSDAAYLGYDPALPALVRASRAARERAATRQWRARQVRYFTISLIIALLALSLSLGLWSFQRDTETQQQIQQQQQVVAATQSYAIEQQRLAEAEADARASAEAQRRRAEQQARFARSSQLAAQAELVLPAYPQRSLLLAIEALGITLRTGEPPVAAAEDAMRQVLAYVGGQGLAGHTGDVTAVALSSDNRWLLTGSADATARLWDLAAPNPAAGPIVLRGHTGPITAAAISPDNRWLVTAGADATARLWDLSAPDPAATGRLLAGHLKHITTIAISPDSHWLATGSADATVRLWDLTIRDPASVRIRLRGHAGPIDAVGFSSDSRWLVTGSADATVRLWNLYAPGGAATFRILRGSTGVAALAISPDKRWLASAGDDAAIRLWDLTTPYSKSTPRVLLGQGGAITALAISLDSHWLSTGSADATLNLWDLAAADPAASARVLRGHAGPVTAIAFSPDGRRLVSAGEDAAIYLWDLATADANVVSTVLHGHEGAIWTIALGSDSRRLVSGGADGSARIWDLASPTGSAPRVLTSHSGVSDADGAVVHARAAQAERAITFACRAAGRNLTLAEWKRYLGAEAYHKTCGDLDLPPDVAPVAPLQEQPDVVGPRSP